MPSRLFFILLKLQLIRLDTNALFFMFVFNIKTTKIYQLIHFLLL